MAKEIKQRIVLDGEAKYNQAIKEAQRNLKTLKSELKAETAELGKNATEQQKAETKAESLKKQIEEQEKIVKTLREALNEAKQTYGDNADVTAKWEQRLNNARATLANMRNGLDNAGDGIQNVAEKTEESVVAAKSFAEAFGDLGDVGNSISSAIESVFKSMIETVTEAVGEMWDLITETAAKANNWSDLANYFGSTASQMQLYDRAISETAGDFGKFTNLVSQLSFGGKNDKIKEWLGVDDANYANNINYTMDVLEALSNAYREWGTGGQWDNMMTDIFGGKKSMDVSWFVTNLDTIKKNRDELMHNGGYLLDKGELETMNQVFLNINKVEQRWDALKEKIAVGLFGDLTLEITTNVEGSLDALARYFNADTPEEREAALDDLKENITATFESIAQAIRDGIALLGQVSDELKESEDPIVHGIGEILGAIVEALQWFTEDNANNVVKALEIIAAFWLTGKGLAMGAKIAEIVGNINAIKLYKSLGGGAAVAGAGAGVGTAATGGSFFGGIGSAIAGASDIIIPGMSLLALAEIGKNMINANLNDENLNMIYGDDEGRDILDRMTEKEWKLARRYEELNETQYGSEEAMDAREALQQALLELGIPNDEQGISLIENIFEEKLNGTDIDGLVEKYNRLAAAILGEENPDWGMPEYLQGAAEQSIMNGASGMWAGSGYDTAMRDPEIIRQINDSNRRTAQQTQKGFEDAIRGIRIYMNEDDVTDHVITNMAGREDMGGSPWVAELQ